MANMAYCRFENTVQDLADCIAHLDDDMLSESEQRERKRLIRLCIEVVQEHVHLECLDTCPICNAGIE